MKFRQDKGGETADNSPHAIWLAVGCLASQMPIVKSCSIVGVTEEMNFDNASARLLP
jgi:hypothetical protein